MPPTSVEVAPRAAHGLGPAPHVVGAVVEVWQGDVAKALSRLKKQLDKDGLRTALRRHAFARSRGQALREKRKRSAGRRRKALRRAEPEA